MLEVFAPLLHEYVLPPLAVNVVLPPEQIEFAPLILALGAELTVNVLLAVAVHPLEPVTVTV